MKTFREFILEARKKETETIDWWGRGKPKAAQKVAQLRQDRNPKRMPANVKKITQITKAIKDKDGRHEGSRPDASRPTRLKNRTFQHGGYAQTGKRGNIGPDPISHKTTKGTTSNVRRSDVSEPSDQITGNIHGTNPGGRGTHRGRAGGLVGRKG